MALSKCIRLLLCNKLIFTGDLISVGSGFDVKERIFRHNLPIFDSKPSFLIKPQMESTQEFHTGSVLWMSPFGKVVAAERDFKINMTNNHHVIHFPEENLNPGLWTVLYFDFWQKLNAIDFLVIESKIDQELIKETPVPLLQNEESLIKTIHTKKSTMKSWLQSVFSLQETCIVNQSCHLTNWSSKSPDSLSTIEL